MPHKKSKSKKSKKSKKSVKKGESLEQLKKQAKRLHVPLSAKGKTKSKAQLKAAIAKAK